MDYISRKIITVGILGSLAVGKTCVLRRFIEEQFFEEFNATIGYSLFIKDIKIKVNDIKKNIPLKIIDTSGLERFFSISIKYVKSCLGILLVYSITDKHSFNYIEKYMKEYNKKKINENVPLILIGNKCDLENERIISFEEGQNLALKYNMKFYETSALDNININDCFQGLIDEITQIYYKELVNKKIEDNNEDIYIGDMKENKKDGYGTMRYKNGDKYEGYWKNDKREGKGKLYFYKGYYDCNWENDLQNGIGKIYYNNNKILEINFKNGKREGKGIITINNKEKYEMKYKNDKIEYYGMINYEDGRILNGIFDNDCNPINGNINYKNGDNYIGELNENGLKNGIGIMKYNNDIIYDGNWENDLKNGNGLLCLNNEDYVKIKDIEISINNIKDIFNLKLNNSFYKGEFINNKKNGKGILFMNKGNYLNHNTIYFGNFLNDNKIGYGCIYFNNENYFECYWNNNNKIDNSKQGIFHINKLIQYKNYYNINEWIKFIIHTQFNYISKKKKHLKSMIR